MYPFRHPSYGRLNRFADHELDDRARRRVAEHLAVCAACRDRVRFIRELDDAARALPVPAPAAGLLERILEDRHAGDRAILPLTDPRSPRWSARRIAGVAALVVFVAVSAGILFSARGLSASHSEMHFLPAHPQTGAAVQVSYRGGGFFSGQMRLQLRARFRDADGTLHQGPVGELIRGRDGTFRATVRLAPATRYAVFSVEKLDGSLVDSNGHQLWDLMVYDRAGRPLAGSLDQRTQDLIGRNWSEALRSARQFTVLYPENAEAWRLRLSLEMQIADGSTRDSLLAAYRQRFQDLDQTLGTRPDVSPREMQAMYFLSRIAGSKARQETWRQRVTREMPRSETGLDIRTSSLVQEYSGRPAVLLARLDALWAQTTDPPPSVALQGILAASRSGQYAALRTWIARFRPQHPEDVRWLADSFGRDPALRPAVVNTIRRYLASLGRDALPRPLFSTVAEYRRQERHTRQLALAEVGKLQVAAGDRSEAAATLAEALTGAWDPAVFRVVANGRLELGDTARAIPVLARVAADPLTPQAFSDSALARLRGRIDGAAWARQVEAARSEMVAGIMAGAVDVPIPESVTVRDASGGAVDLRSALRDSVTLVALWSPRVGAALQDLPALRATARRLTAEGVRTVVITPDAPSPAFRALARARHLPGRVLHGMPQQAAQAFDNWTIPGYFLTDVNGRIRFTDVSLREAAREAAVLKLIPPDRIVAVR